MSKIKLTPTSSESELINSLLGRPSRFPFQIISRCPSGSPRVILSSPIYWENNRWKPFPSFLWLVCPRLKHSISKLESEHFSKKVVDLLKTDESFLNKYLVGQQAVAAWRCKLAREQDAEAMSSKIEEVLGKTNIAGSRNFTSIKCLHSHVAQTLSFGQNPVGEMVLKHVGHCTLHRSCT